MTYTVYHIRNGTVSNHIVFAPKYRRKAFYESRRLDVGRMLRQLCGWKHVNIIEAEVCVEHVHAHVSRNTTKNECFWFCQIFKREKQPNDI